MFIVAGMINVHPAYCSIVAREWIDRASVLNVDAQRALWQRDVSFGDMAVQRFGSVKVHSTFCTEMQV